MPRVTFQHLQGGGGGGHHDVGDSLLALGADAAPTEQEGFPGLDQVYLLPGAQLDDSLQTTQMRVSRSTPPAHPRKLPHILVFACFSCGILTAHKVPTPPHTLRHRATNQEDRGGLDHESARHDPRGHARLGGVLRMHDDVPPSGEW